MKKKIFYLVILLCLMPLLSCGQTQGIEIGKKVFDVSGENPEGETIGIESLKGKLVLIDFWASWCQPCRMENPNLVSAYKQYKDANFSKGNGFEIFSISLDRKKTDWVKAIEKDGLIWSYHICDFKEWYSALVDKFELESIPANFLIDSEGVIIAKDLRGDALENTLKALKK